MSSSIVSPVAEARAGLSQILAEFRANPDSAAPIVIGAHRRPEAVLLPFKVYEREFTGDAAQPARAVLDVLLAKKPLITRIAALNRARGLAVFGSVARRQERSDSDVDFLVDPDDEATLFDLAQLEMDLESLFDRPVDIVSRRSLDVDSDAEIFREAIPLWR